MLVSTPAVGVVHQILTSVHGQAFEQDVLLWGSGADRPVPFGLPGQPGAVLSQKKKTWCAEVTMQYGWVAEQRGQGQTVDRHGDDERKRGTDLYSKMSQRSGAGLRKDKPSRRLARGDGVDGLKPRITTRSHPAFQCQLQTTPAPPMHPAAGVLSAWCVMEKIGVRGRGP